MPNEDGKLTESELAILKEWFDDKWTNYTCTVCGTKKWSADPHIVLLPLHLPGKTVLGGPTFPAIPVLCVNCGHTVFFNAIRIGVMAADTPKVEKEDKDVKQSS